MKTIVTLAGLSIVVCGLAAAQTSTGNRIVIPSRNTARPRQVKIHTLNVPITVKGYDGKDVVVESGSPPPSDSQGMHRIDVPRGMTIEEADNVIEIRTSPFGKESNLVVMVPTATALDLHSLNGAVRVEGVQGEVVAHTTNGRIDATNISGTVVADTLNGRIQVVMDRVDQSKPLFFSTLNGGIDVTVPADIKANVRFKTLHGPVNTDFAITMGGSLTEPDNSGQGRYRLRSEGPLEGRINGGGVQIEFRTLNAPIYLRKK